MRQDFENWMKSTEGKSDNTAYQYANSINKIAKHYAQGIGKDINIYQEKDILIIEEISSDYGIGGRFESFGRGGNGTIRNAIAAYLRFLKNWERERELPGSEVNTSIQSQNVETRSVEDEIVSEGLNFTYEKDLKNSLVNQAHQLFPGYKIHGDQQEGVEYNIEGKRIDLLMENINDHSLLAVELKSGEADFRVFGQISMYLGLLSKKFPNREVRGVIVAGKINETLQYACLTNEKVSLKTYQMQLTLNDVV